MHGTPKAKAAAGWLKAREGIRSLCSASWLKWARLSFWRYGIGIFGIRKLDRGADPGASAAKLHQGCAAVAEVQALRRGPGKWLPSQSVGRRWLPSPGQGCRSPNKMASKSVSNLLYLNGILFQNFLGLSSPPFLGSFMLSD